MKKILFIAALFAPTVLAAPFVVSDPLDNQSVTHCQFSLNGGTTWTTDLPVTGTPRICYADMQSFNIPAGNFSIIARAVIVDPIWGRLESPASLPFAGVRPAAPNRPAGTRVVATVP